MLVLSVAIAVSKVGQEIMTKLMKGGVETFVISSLVCVFIIYCGTVCNVAASVTSRMVTTSIRDSR